MIPVEPEERSALAGEYVLGLLEPAEAAAVEAAAPIDAALGADVAYWEERLSALCETVQPVVPDAGLWARIERDLGLAAPPRRAPSPGPFARAWQSLGFWRLAAATAGIAALAIAGLFGTLGERAGAPA